MSVSWGRIIVGAVLIVIGALWLGEVAGIIEFPLRALTPLALVGVGIGLVVGARHGSYPVLIVVGAVLTVLLAIGSTDDRRVVWERLPIRSEVGVGDHVERPRDASDLHPYDVRTGRLTIDLTRMRLRERTYEVSARVGAGQLVVIVPEGVPLRVKARSGVGNVQIPGDTSTGIGADQEFEAPGFDDARPRFDLDLSVGVGSIRVTQGRRVPVELRSRSS